MPNKVYVINKHGRPLMPCSPAKARHLLDAGKAKVKKRTPFTIQLVYGSSGYTQEVILGVDAGSKTIGMSASTTKEELLSAEVKPRNDVVDLLSTRREFRRVRRNRKTRYRKPRFDNRVRSKHKGWLAPSVEVKIQEHITSIKRVCRILPVSKVVIETAEFEPSRKANLFRKVKTTSRVRCTVTTMYGNTCFGETTTLASVVEHTQPRKKRSGFTSTIWRAGR